MGATIRFGFYSAKQEAFTGTSIYATPEGKEVEITSVLADPEGKGCSWDDKVSLGPVTHWVRYGKQPTGRVFEKRDVTCKECIKRKGER